MVWVSAGSALHVLRVRHPFRAAIGTAVLLGAIGSCVTNVRYESVPLAGPRVVRSPVKAHLVDGSTIVFSDGVTIDNSLVTGDGARFDIRLDPVGAVPGVALDSVLAMESFRTETDILNSIASVYLHTGAITAVSAGSCCRVLGFLPHGVLGWHGSRSAGGRGLLVQHRSDVRIARCRPTRGRR